MDASLSFTEVDKVIDAIKQCGDRAEQIINTYLHNQGAEAIKNKIQPLLPSSGRSWKKKKTAASRAAPFTETGTNLAIRVHTKKPYHYLYFPDDGSNTVRHFGNQHFMERGGEASTDEIAENIINKLLENF